ncbi:HAMP domain-containing protein [candidate division KSB1 bacterium]|nr:HAMP domain-containing protein [candidate division KSB1 bacterium]
MEIQLHIFELISKEIVKWAFHSIFGLAVLLAAGGAFYLSRKISRPISDFAKSATSIARGNFTHRVNVNSNDEIGKLAKIFNYMTTELQRLHEMNLNKIISEKNKTETIIKNIADGVIVTDPDNRILVLNSVAENWFGLKEREVMQHPLENFIHDEELVSLIKNIRNSCSNHSSALEIQLKPTKTRRDIILQAKAARVVRNKDDLIGIVTILRDITREKEIDRMKTELVSMVAHELRSPLTSISGFSELLLDQNLSEEQSKEYAEIILKESNRLGDLINKFLDISKIEAGKSQINREPTSIKEIIDKVVDLNIHQAGRKKLSIDINISPEIPLVLVDKEMISEVVLNLFSNAIKYSPEKANVNIVVTHADGFLQIAVRDTGYGISKESLPKIFNKFYRVDDDENVRDTTGSGLGLALVKEIVELHGGSVHVKSKLGEGSTFTVKLPTGTESEESYFAPEFLRESLFA